MDRTITTSLPTRKEFQEQLRAWGIDPGGLNTITFGPDGLEAVLYMRDDDGTLIACGGKPITGTYWISWPEEKSDD